MLLDQAKEHLKMRGEVLSLIASLFDYLEQAISQVDADKTAMANAGTAYANLQFKMGLGSRVADIDQAIAEIENGLSLRERGSSQADDRFGRALEILKGL